MDSLEGLEAKSVTNSDSLMELYRQAWADDDAGKVKIDPDELDLLTLPQRYSAVEVAKKIQLSGKSNLLESIDLSLTPYMVHPLTLIGNDQIHWIITIAPTQSGKTVQLQVFVADAIDQDPGTMIYVLPDEKSGAKALEEKVISMIKTSPFLRKHTIAPDNKNLTTTTIRLDNMTIYPAWSGSLASLSSTPAKRVVLDEVRLMKLAIGNESNAIKLANDRMTTFKSHGLAQGMMVSTPSIEGDLLHQQLSVPGTTVLWWYVPCPTCGKYQILDFFQNMRWSEERGKAICKCKFEGCTGEFGDSDSKVSWNSKGVYAVEGQEGLSHLQTPELTPRVAHRYCSMVSPFRSFAAIWNEYIETRDKPQDYRNFIQCWLAKFWADTVSGTTVEELEARQCDYGRRVVPDETLVLTAGVDTQDDGFYVEVRAWGPALQTWLIDSFFIPCSLVAPAKSIAKLLKKHIEDAVYQKENGERWMIALWAQDIGGHRTTELKDAASYLHRQIRVLGRNQTQRETIQYWRNDDYYTVRTNEYAEETEVACTKDGWWLYRGVSRDYTVQYLNYGKVKKFNVKTGETTYGWKKLGQNDYRMASIHAWICLDIDIGAEESTIRRMLTTEGWSLNPYRSVVQKEGKLDVQSEREKLLVPKGGFVETPSNYLGDSGGFGAFFGSY